MAKEQLRSASKTLSPLLRRRGTSPAVGSALRRTVQALDKALAAPEGQATPVEIRQALAELRGCLVHIYESTRPADQEQLEGAAKALSFLAPLEAGLPPPPTEQASSQPAQTPSVFQTVVASDLPPPPTALTPLPPRRARSARQPRPLPVLDVGSAEIQLAGLHGSLHTLHAVLHESTQRLLDLDRAAEVLHAHQLAITWLGPRRTPTWAKASREAKQPEQRLVASAALGHVEAPGGAERSMTVLERSAHGKTPLDPFALTILRTLAGPHFLECVRTVFAKTSNEMVRSLLLPLLVERGQIRPEQIWPLLDHADDRVAREAALALALVGDTQHASALATLAGRAQAPRRSNALLFAASALGSVLALAEVRARVQRREEIDECLVDALAIAGDDADASLLMDLAAHPASDTGYVVFAAANLGCMATVRALPLFADRVPKHVLDEAQRLILGNGAEPLPNPAPPVRLLHGQPWSVPGLLARLAARDETICSRQRLALEIRVRTGLAAPALLPVLSPAQAQTEALADWACHFAKASARLPAGQWYYQGKPAKLARKEIA